MTTQEYGIVDLRVHNLLVSTRSTTDILSTYSKADIPTTKTARGAILTFLLVQVTHNATGGAVGAAGFFNNYIQYLPNNFPLPTFWDDQERSLVQGTSLETALSSKLSSLDREFSLLRGKTSSITWCQQHWWDPAMGLLSIEDWKAVDAMYRSRALDLPGKGHAVVPFIDMANHASGDCTVALYETDSDGNALLLLRDGKTLNTSEEVTITYGDEKGACEMLFSYGFLEENMRSCRELFLELNIPEDDPLKLAKKRVSKTAPGFRLFDREGVTDWEGPYIWLLCVNEEDGLEFKLLQRTDGDTDVQALWKGREIEDMIQLQDLLRGDAMKDVFLLRAISILQSRVEDQLVRMENSKNLLLPMRQENENHVGSYPNIMKLRDLEETLLLQAYEEFEDQVSMKFNGFLSC